MAESFGRYLRREREMREIPLEQISAETKIKRSLLEALEHDRTDQIPSVAIVKGFLRAYARILGLSASDLQLRYESFLKEVDPSRLETLAPRPWVPRKRRRLPRVAWLLLLALGVGVGLHIRGGESPLAPRSEQASVEREASRVVFRKNYLRDLETDAPPGTPPFLSAASPPGTEPQGGGLYLVFRALAPCTSRIVLDSGKAQTITFLPGQVVVRHAARLAVLEGVDLARLLVQANGVPVIPPGFTGLAGRLVLRSENEGEAQGEQARSLPPVWVEVEAEGEGPLPVPMPLPALPLPKPSK